MEKEIDGLILELQEHLKDSTRRTHKMLINTISAITVHLDRDQITVTAAVNQKKEHFVSIAEMVLTLISYPYEQNKTNLELIVRLLSQIVLR